MVNIYNKKNVKKTLTSLIIIILLSVSVGLNSLPVKAETNVFGYTTIGSTSTGFGGDYFAAFPINVTETTTINTISLYCAFSEATDMSVALYNGTAPTFNLIAYSSEITVGTDLGWYNFTISNTNIDTGIYYILENHPSAAGNIALRYDADGTISYYAASTYDYPSCWNTTLTSTGQWSSRHYSAYIAYNETPTTTPSYSNLTVSTTRANSICDFSATFSDGTALQSNGRYVFETNNTGVWVADSYINFTSTPQTITVSKTLNATVGTVVSYRWNFTNNAGNSNTTGVQNITLRTQMTDMVDVTPDTNNEVVAWFTSITTPMGNDTVLTMSLDDFQANFTTAKNECSITGFIVYDFGFMQGYDRTNFTNTGLAQLFPVANQTGIKLYVGVLADYMRVEWNSTYQTDLNTSLLNMGTWIVDNNYLAAFGGLVVDGANNAFGVLQPTLTEFDFFVSDALGINNVPVIWAQQNVDWEGNGYGVDANAVISTYNYDGYDDAMTQWETFITYNNDTESGFWYNLGGMSPILDTFRDGWNASALRNQVDYCVSNGNMTHYLQYFCWMGGQESLSASDSMSKYPDEWGELQAINNEFLYGEVLFRINGILISEYTSWKGISIGNWFEIKSIG